MWKFLIVFLVVAAVGAALLFLFYPISPFSPGLQKEIPSVRPNTLQNVSGGIPTPPAFATSTPTSSLAKTSSLKQKSSPPAVRVTQSDATRVVQISSPITTPVSTLITVSSSSLPQEVSIPAKSLVGLLCYYSSKNPSITASSADENGKVEVKGSGVIINPAGYILTARHVIDPAWYASVYRNEISDGEAAVYSILDFDYCEVGIPQSDTLPSPDQIRSFNPQLTLEHPFPYLAENYFVPPRGTLTDAEYKNLDFAILKISKPREDCVTWNLCTLPAEFPYSRVWYGDIPTNAPELLNFGYPAELINESGGTFTNFFLKGAVGTLEKIFVGDSYFGSTLFTLKWKADDIRPGRSGSPVFWKGRVIGVVYAGLTADMTQNLSVSTMAIQKTLQDNGLGGLLYKE